MAWGSKEERVRLDRIRIAIYAYAYEFEDDSLISDCEYDKLAKELDTDTKTGCEIHDKFFREKYQPYTGQWIGQHPNLKRIKEIYNRYYKND